MSQTQSTSPSQKTISPLPSENSSKVEQSSPFPKTKSSLSSLKKPPETKTFVQVVLGYIQSFFSCLIAWIKWLFDGSTSEKENLDPTQKIIQNPRKQVKKVFENPTEEIAKIIESAFEHPGEFEKTIQNQAYKDFLAMFKQGTVDAPELLTGQEGVIEGIKSILNYFEMDRKQIDRKNPTFNILINFMKENLESLGSVFANFCKEVGNSFKKENTKADFFYRIFNEHLPSLFSISEITKDSTPYKQFIQNLFSLVNLDENNLIQLLKNLPNWKNEMSEDFVIALKKEGVQIKQLQYESLSSFFFNIKPIDLKATFLKSLIRHTPLQTVRNLAENFSENFPLLSEILNHFVEVASNDEKQRELWSLTFSEAKYALNILYDTYANLNLSSKK